MDSLYPHTFVFIVLQRLSHSDAYSFGYFLSQGIILCMQYMVFIHHHVFTYFAVEGPVGVGRGDLGFSLITYSMKNSVIFSHLQLQISLQLCELDAISFTIWVRTWRLREGKKLSCRHMATQQQSPSLTLTRFSVYPKPAVSLLPFLGGPVFPLDPVCSRLKRLPPPAHFWFF